jgi:hypothetical protein
LEISKLTLALHRGDFDVRDEVAEAIYMYDFSTEFFLITAD